MKTRKAILVAVIVLVLGTPCMWGARLIQDSEPAAPAPEANIERPTPKQTQPVKRVLPKAPAERTGKVQNVPDAGQENVQNPDDDAQQVTMDFDGVDIKVFIKFIADITGRNFILDEKVSGKVTVISPRKMSLDEAYQVFLSVLEVNGYGTVRVGGVTKIVKSAEAITKSLETTMDLPALREDRMVTQIIPLKHADANDMRTLLSPLISKGTSQLLAYPQSNVLIITDTMSNIQKIVDILNVVDVTGFAQEVRIFTLTYASASDLSTKLTEILAEDKTAQTSRIRTARQAGVVGGKASAKIIPYERTNALIVLASAMDMPEIEILIKTLDIPTPSGKEDIHVYYLQYANAEDMAKVLTDIPTPESPEAANAVKGKTTAARGTSQNQEIKISSDPETNSLIIYADPYAYRTIVETIKYLDIPRKQVYIKALIMEVNTEKDFKVGVEWTFFEDFKYDDGQRIGGVFGRTGQSFISSPADLPSGSLLGVVGETITIGSGDTQITFPNMTSFINAMATDSDVHIISTPQIITMDNKEAEIKVGANVPYVTKTDTDSTNINRTVRTFDYRDVGVTLRLTPQINQQGNIRIELFQENTTLVPGQGEEEFAPTTLKRSATTTVTVKDGSTMVIGGLIGDTLTLGDTRVPLLSRIPLLGYLFKSMSNVKETTNLYIFLTPRIIDTDDKVEGLYQEKYKELKDSKVKTRNGKDDENPKP
ncbi:MAG TPA: type II secretion system secretin GspD [Deltaproteobacteria bacterium]|nr:type II secretion system secretin GspD [Deltaproteobacteria bacterium]HPR50522.1 type II secretion system secretin GspD [Deltaproteobacteria bacterium]